MQPATIPQPITAELPRTTHTFWRGIWIGLIPLGLLVATIGLSIGFAILARLVSVPAGFLVWRWIVEGIWVGGLVIAAVVFLYATFRVLRVANRWQRVRLQSQASGVFWALGISALLILLPLLIAVMLPQQPAPETSLSRDGVTGARMSAEGAEAFSQVNATQVEMMQPITSSGWPVPTRGHSSALDGQARPASAHHTPSSSGPRQRHQDEHPRQSRAHRAGAIHALAAAH